MRAHMHASPWVAVRYAGAPFVCWWCLVEVTRVCAPTLTYMAWQNGDRRHRMSSQIKDTLAEHTHTRGLCCRRRASFLQPFPLLILTLRTILTSCSTFFHNIFKKLSKNWNRYPFLWLLLKEQKKNSFLHSFRWKLFVISKTCDTDKKLTFETCY